MERNNAKENAFMIETELRHVHAYLKACESYKEEIRPLVDNVAKSVNKIQMHADKLLEANENQNSEQIALTAARQILLEAVRPAILAVLQKSNSEFFSRYQGWMRPHFQTMCRVIILMHYIEHGTLIGVKEMMQLLFGSDIKHAAGDGEPNELAAATTNNNVSIPLMAFDSQDYLNGLLDVPDDLVRLARNYASSKQFDKTQRVCDFLRTLIAELRLLATDISGFDLKQRVDDIRKYQLRTVETILFVAAKCSLNLLQQHATLLVNDKQS